MDKKKIMFACIIVALALLIPINRIEYKGVDGVMYGIGYKSALYEVIRYVPYAGATGGIEIQLLGNEIYNNVIYPGGLIIVD